MNKLLQRLLVFSFLTIGIGFSVHAQAIYVKVRPVVPVVVRPVAPSPNHVWIAEEWHPRVRPMFMPAAIGQLRRSQDGSGFPVIGKNMNMANIGFLVIGAIKLNA